MKTPASDVVQLVLRMGQVKFVESCPILDLFSVQLLEATPNCFQRKSAFLHKSCFKMIFQEIISINALFVMYRTLPLNSRL